MNDIIALPQPIDPPQPKAKAEGVEEVNELRSIVPRHIVQYEHVLSALESLQLTIQNSWEMVEFLDKLTESEYLAWMQYAYTHPVETPITAPYSQQIMVAPNEQDVHFIPPKTWQESLREEEEAKKPHPAAQHRLA